MLRSLGITVTLLLIGWAPATLAQDNESATGPLSKLQIHGFLTQAYADAKFTTGGFNSPTQDEIVIGIPEDGTTDYRTLALQFRYNITPKDRMIVQLSSRALGSSPIAVVEDEVELDWAFYERRFGKSSYVKVGRIQTPFGIFNEIRDVGTLLPFYRPPFSFYREGSFTSETVDGVMAGHTFAANSAWNISVDAFAGGWDMVEFAPPGLSDIQVPALVARANDAIGVHAWLGTPISGLRFGAGFQTYDVSGGILELPGTSPNWQDWLVSLDAVFEKWIFRTEFRNLRPTVTSLLPTTFNADIDNLYAQLGFHPGFKWRFYLQYEQTKDDNVSTSLIETFSRTSWREYAVAINYAFNANLVLKAEFHDIDLVQTATIVPVLPPPAPNVPPLLRFVGQDATNGEQFILSLSASF